MPNPLMSNMPDNQPTPAQQETNRTIQFVQLLRAAKRDPQGAFAEMMRINPQFNEFMKSNQGKTAQQFAQEHGIDLSQVLNKI